MILDIKRAFLYGRTLRKIYIRLPQEDPMSKVPGMVGRLLKAMYGTRDAPAIWQQEVRRVLTAIGFRKCSTTPCVYHRPEKDIRVVTHVDEFLATGPDEELQWMYK